MVVVFLLLTGCGAPPPKVTTPVAVVPGVAPEPVTLETVNRRWSGQRCQLRVEAEIRRGTDRMGWSSSGWMTAPTLPGDKKVEFRILVSDRAVLVNGGYLRRNRTIRPGTVFRSRGWRLTDPRKQRGLVIDLEFEQVPVQARMVFRGGDRLVDLEDVERIARIELFQLLTNRSSGRGIQRPVSMEESDAT